MIVWKLFVLTVLVVFLILHGYKGLCLFCSVNNERLQRPAVLINPKYLNPLSFIHHLKNSWIEKTWETLKKPCWQQEKTAIKFNRNCFSYIGKVCDKKIKKLYKNYEGNKNGSKEAKPIRLSSIKIFATHVFC